MVVEVGFLPEVPIDIWKIIVILVNSIIQQAFFMASPSTYVSSSARGLLVAYKLMQYSEPYLVPDFMKKADIKKNNKKQVTQAAFVKVYPNPAKDFVTIEYDLCGKKGNSIINIADQSGKQVKSISVIKIQDQILVETKGLISGTYFVQLIESGKMIASCKFVIIK